MKKIVFIISHRPDNRYMKRLNLLKQTFEIELIFWNKSENVTNSVIDGVKIHEIHIPANQTNPLKRIPQTIQFIRKAYTKLSCIGADIVYVGNLDMLYITRKYKKRCNLNSNIIYEIADLHRLIIDKQRGAKKIIGNALKTVEKQYIKSVDILVLTSMKFYEIYYSRLISKDKVAFLPNMPEDYIFEDYKPIDRTGQPFTVGFIGWIRYKNQLKMLIEAAGKVGCKVMFAGADGEGTDFEDYCKKFDYVSYLGSFSYEEKIKELYDQIDCVYAVYDADMANVRVALPNKLYEAIDCEKPIIVAKNTYLGELVKEYGVGMAVNHRDAQELIAVLKKMINDSEYYSKLCKNSRAHKKEISLEKYNNDFINQLKNIN